MLLTTVCLFGKLRFMTTLHSYLEVQNVSLSAFARSIGRSASTLTRALCGQRAPSFSLALDVERGTDSAVTAEEFLSICMMAHRSFCFPDRDQALSNPPASSSAGDVAGALVTPPAQKCAPASLSSSPEVLQSGEAGVQRSAIDCTPAVFLMEAAR